VSRLGWIAATAGAIGVIGAAAWYGARGQRQLGATSRRGERRGAIDVPDEDIARTASKIMASFQRCDGDDGTDWLTPKGSVFSTIIVPMKSANGERIDVAVSSEPTSYRVSPAGAVAGQLETAIHGSGRVSRRIVVFPAEKACKPKAMWGPRIREVLAHEMAHAADPVTERNARNRKSAPTVATQADLCRYYNHPTEVTAHLAEVEYELRSKLGRIRSGHELYPRDPLDLLGTSPSWQAMARCLTAANRRRFLRMAAILYQRLDA
jgi:hypothetical protein